MTSFLRASSVRCLLPASIPNFPVSLSDRRSVMSRAEALLWRAEFNRRQLALLGRCTTLSDYTAGLPAIMEEMIDWVPNLLEAR
jgi:hypothetical protein